ncbi:MAG: hypothetical protein JKY20_01000 [Alphaproteobacteria bacterium]|nr:hypothetical protein [Alphaproteobacteria bacterium]
MALHRQFIKRAKVLLFAALGSCAVFLNLGEVDATALRMDTPIGMEEVGEALAPFDPAEDLNDTNSRRRGQVKNINDLDEVLRANIFAGTGVAQVLAKTSGAGESVALNLGVDDLVLSLVNTVSINGAIVLKSVLQRNAATREDLLAQASNLISINSTSIFGGVRTENWLPENNWADFRNLATANMTPAALIWLEGSRWASFYSAILLSDNFGSSSLNPSSSDPSFGASSLETWAPRTLGSKPSGAKKNQLKNAPSYLYSNNGSSSNGAPGVKSHKPVRRVTFQEFALKFLSRIFRSPIFYIVIVLAVALIGTRQLIRARR